MNVTLDWMGCATFRLTLGDLVIFLDAYIDRVPSAVPIGITVDEIDRAHWIVVGHSHFDHGSICVPGSYVSKSSSRAPNNAFPRRLTLCTNSKKPKYNGKWSCEMPRCGRSHDLSSDQKPSMVLT